MNDILDTILDSTTNTKMGDTTNTTKGDNYSTIKIGSTSADVFTDVVTLLVNS